MATLLSFEQIRVLGVFIEKEKTTPDQYPLSINAITTACNQKSNREPVTNFTEVEVQNTVDELMQLRILDDVPASRVTKYRHRFYGSEFSAYKFNQAEAAILAVLFLRGPQTPGELRTRTQRLHAFSDVGEVEQTLDKLSQQEPQAYVLKLAREPGKREARYAQLFSEQTSTDIAVEASIGTDNNHSDLTMKVEALEQEVNELRAEIAQIKQSLGLTDD
ncbi:DUF480 domain-containing protein [Catenovulum sp. SM1970]|uniref:YceH family protein n=1 Tax=Marinifaba aquimaris TaxID=2741323 RepID=UPI0015725F0C|nr:DUF480 domain-containing protein [Marinifaba aquimaris]NTS78783.1 DUF480 domain-containing protein [Marinifaba aquimaris]